MPRVDGRAARRTYSGSSGHESLHSEGDGLSEALPNSVFRAVMLQENEEILTSTKSTLLDMDIGRNNPDFASVLLNDSARQSVKKWGFPGYLVVTNKRLLFVEQQMGVWGPKDEFSLRDVIDLECVQGMSIYEKFQGGLRLNVTYVSQGVPHEKGFKGPDEAHLAKLKKAIEVLVTRRSREIDEEKSRDRVQYVIDFSFLKAEVEKGGFSLSTARCPSCSANVDVPESGSFFKCSHCGNTIRATDLFERLKGLMKGL